MLRKDAFQHPPPPFHGHYTAGTSSSELADLADAKFYCPHALADGKQCIQITEKTLEF